MKKKYSTYWQENGWISDDGRFWSADPNDISDYENAIRHYTEPHPILSQDGYSCYQINNIEELYMLFNFICTKHSDIFYDSDINCYRGKTNYKVVVCNLHNFYNVNSIDCEMNGSINHINNLENKIKDLKENIKKERKFIKFLKKCQEK